MGEIENAGYEDLRTYIMANWETLEIGNSDLSTTTERTVGDGSPSPPEWNTAATANPIEIEVVMRGEHNDVATGITYSRSRLKKGVTVMSDENFSGFTINQADDQLTVRHQLEVPEIV